MIYQKNSVEWGEDYERAYHQEQMLNEARQTEF
jgi:hypothetical protein